MKHLCVPESHSPVFVQQMGRILNSSFDFKRVENEAIKYLPLFSSEGIDHIYHLYSVKSPFPQNTEAVKAITW